MLHPLTLTMLTLPSFLFAVGVVIIRATHSTLPPVGLSFWRWGLGALILALAMTPAYARDIRAVLRHSRYYAEMGFYMTTGSTLAAAGLTFTQASNGSLVNASQPALVALFAWILTGTRLTPRQAAGTLVAALGILTIVSRADLDVLEGLHFNIGDLLIICGMVFHALYAVKLARLPRELPFGVNLSAILLCGVVALLPFYVAESYLYMTVPSDPMSLGILCYLGTLGSLIPVLMWSKVVPMVGPNRASVFINLMPVFGASLAVVFLDERLYVYHFAGAALIFCGIALVLMRSK